MGVTNLWQILGPVQQHVHLSSLRGQTLAVDLSIWVCEMQCVQQMQGVVSKPFLRNLFFRINCLLNLGVCLIFVIEGDAPELKWDTMSRRQQSRFEGHQATQSHSRGNKRGVVKTRRNFNTKLKECCELLDCLGISYIQSQGEAEAMCAALNAAGLVDGCITNDGDAFLYGARTVYRNFTINLKDPHVDCYKMDDVESQLGLNQKSLVALGLLLGCDYLPKGVPGIGTEKAIHMMHSLQGEDILKRFYRWKSMSESECTEAERVVRKKAMMVPDFPQTKIIEEFLMTKDKCPKFIRKWGRPLLGRLQKFALQKMEWPVEYTLEKLLPLITLWDLTDIQKPDSVSAGIRLKPLRIVKSRVRQGIPCFEIEWEKPEDCEETLEGVPVYSTIESQDIFIKCYPDLVQIYELAMLEKKSKSKGCKKKKKAVLEPEKQKEKLISDDLELLYDSLAGLDLTGETDSWLPNCSVKPINPHPSKHDGDIDKQVCMMQGTNTNLQSQTSTGANSDVAEEEEEEEEEEIFEYLPLSQRINMDWGDLKNEKKQSCHIDKSKATDSKLFDETCVSKTDQLFHPKTDLQYNSEFEMKYFPKSGMQNHPEIDVKHLPKSSKHRSIARIEKVKTHSQPELQYSKADLPLDNLVRDNREELTCNSNILLSTKLSEDVPVVCISSDEELESSTLPRNSATDESHKCEKSEVKDHSSLRKSRPVMFDKLDVDSSHCNSVSELECSNKDRELNKKEIGHVTLLDHLNNNDSVTQGKGSCNFDLLKTEKKHKSKTGVIKNKLSQETEVSAICRTKTPDNKLKDTNCVSSKKVNFLPLMPGIAGNIKDDSCSPLNFAKNSESTPSCSRKPGRHGFHELEIDSPIFFQKMENQLLPLGISPVCPGNESPQSFPSTADLSYCTASGHPGATRNRQYRLNTTDIGKSILQFGNFDIESSLLTSINKSYHESINQTPDRQRCDQLSLGMSSLTGTDSDKQVNKDSNNDDAILKFHQQSYVEEVSGSLFNDPFESSLDCFDTTDNKRVGSQSHTQNNHIEMSRKLELDKRKKSSILEAKSIESQNVDITDVINDGKCSTRYDENQKNTVSVSKPPTLNLNDTVENSENIQLNLPCKNAHVSPQHNLAVKNSNKELDKTSEDFENSPLPLWQRLRSKLSEDSDVNLSILGDITGRRNKLNC